MVLQWVGDSFSGAKVDHLSTHRLNDCVEGIIMRGCSHRVVCILTRLGYLSTARNGEADAINLCLSLRKFSCIRLALRPSKDPREQTA